MSSLDPGINRLLADLKMNTDLKNSFWGDSGDGSFEEEFLNLN